ncbi:amidohydrolase family protein [Bordetella sp. 2513F-2]
MRADTAPLAAGACDCHVHVIGEPARYPMMPDRHYTPGPASPEALRAHLARVGASRAVIVQPSVYGTDNRCMLDALAALQGAARGVAVLDVAASDDALARLHAAGVRGVRVNLESVGASEPQAVARALQRWAGRLAGSGWHVQVYASAAALAAAAGVLRAMAVPVVLDHFAMIPVDTPLSEPGVREILGLVASGAAYVKLSAPYRIGGGAGQDHRVAELAHAFLRANPERVLWASDWPHTNREPGRLPTEVSAYRAIDAGDLRQAAAQWLADPDTRLQVLVENPQRLYGF